MSKWKPGQLVTIDGVVYQVKRANPCYIACSLCNFRNCGACFLPRHYIPYPIPHDCYFKRLSPIIKWGFNTTR